MIKFILLKKVPAVFLPIFLFSTTLFSQNLPSASSCTSKDLELVGASLPPPNNDPCACGGTRTLMLTINNKTGSTRTSFALWGTLQIFNSDGSLKSSESIFACAPNIPKSATTTLPSNKQITFGCGESLKIINLFLAWTSASPNETCAVLEASPSTIAPKCGTLPEIRVVAGLDADCTPTAATCPSGKGSILVSPFGGVGPYTVAIGSDSRNVAAGASTTFSNLNSGTYTVNLTDSRGCTSQKSSTINSPDVPNAPTSGGDQTVCAQNPVQKITATATAPSGSTVVWYDAATNGNVVADPSLNSVGSVTYYAQSVAGVCNSTTRTAVTLTIKATPNAPTSGGNQTECEQNPIQKLTATATPPANATVVWYDAATNGNIVADPSLNSIGTVTYYAQSVLNGCNSLSRTAVTLTIKVTPAAPTSGDDQTECAQNPVQKLTATTTPPAGASVAWYDAATNGNLVNDPSLNSVGTVTYYAQSILNGCNSFTRTAVTLTIKATPAAPTSGGNQTECAQNPVQKLTATATPPAGASVAWYDAATNGNLVNDPSLNSVGTITYYAQSELNGCNSLTRTAVTLTIKATPAAPTSGGSQTECEQNPVQKLTATATPPAGSSIVWYDAATNGNLVNDPSLNSVGTVTYYAQSALDGCNSLTRTAVTLTINPKPQIDACAIQPTLCSKGSVTITATGGSDFMYSIKEGTDGTWQTSNTFPDLDPGDITGIKVKNSDGCLSAELSCNNLTDCAETIPTTNLNTSTESVSSRMLGSANLESSVTVKPMPNPFSNQVRFMIATAQAGNGTLDLYNIAGQKVKTIYQGYIPAGVNYFDLRMGSQQKSELIYILKIGDQKVSGKLLQLGSQ